MNNRAVAVNTLLLKPLSHTEQLQAWLLYNCQQSNLLLELGNGIAISIPYPESTELVSYTPPFRRQAVCLMSKLRNHKDFSCCDKLSTESNSGAEYVQLDSIPGRFSPSTACPCIGCSCIDEHVFEYLFPLRDFYTMGSSGYEGMLSCTLKVHLEPSEPSEA